MWEHQINALLLHHPTFLLAGDGVFLSLASSVIKGFCKARRDRGGTDEDGKSPRERLAWR